MSRPLSSLRRARAGFTLLEVVVSMGVLLIAFSMLSSSLVSIAKQRWINWENTIAGNAGRRVVEDMHNTPFDQLFAIYNADETDDPLGVGTAVGHRFAVLGLDPLDDAVDGMVGEIRFPSLDVGGTPAIPLQELREDLVDAELGMPRDLNGDSIIDGFDHSGDYVILPVIITLRWRGKTGPRELRVCSALCRFNR